MLNSSLRGLAVANHFMVWLSAVIVTGVVSWFISRFSTSANSTHIIYQEVIATITLVLWTIGMVLPLVGAYRGHLWPVNLAFSYLWLTSFIFSAQDWANGRCHVVGPGYGRCNLKRTVAAFNFLAFFFLLCNTLVEGLIFRRHRDDVASRGGLAKNDRPSSSTGAGQRGTVV
ncbi:might be a transmembrane protein, partial [Metarhizium majus ARSEF 297]